MPTISLVVGARVNQHVQEKVNVPFGGSATISLSLQKWREMEITLLLRNGSGDAGISMDLEWYVDDPATVALDALLVHTQTAILAASGVTGAQNVKSGERLDIVLNGTGTSGDIDALVVVRKLA